MVQPRKVIYVDFNEKKRSQPFIVGGGPKMTVLVFFGSLCALVVLAALFFPQQITSGFFAPTVIALSVIAALLFKRALIALHIRHMHKKMGDKQREAGNRTLH